jgi:hypothetical protein
MIVTAAMGAAPRSMTAGLRTFQSGVSQTGERRTPASAAAQRELLTSFITAARSGDMTALEQLFAPDVTSLSDGNGATGLASCAWRNT